MHKKLTILYIVSILTAAILITGCKPKAVAKENSEIQLAVFVPGVLAGSPTYEMMDKGVRKAAEEKAAEVKTVEGGFNQAEWKSQIMALASEKKYDIIVTSNPAMPEICREVKKIYTDQSFLILEGSKIENDTVSTFLFSHLELAYLHGYFAGLVTRSEMPGANSDLKIGLIAGQEYPEMNQKIRPGYLQGLQAAAAGAEVDFRVIGNWYDATKASDLAKSMFESGVDVILTIAGGANQGVISAAKEAGKYVLWYDADGYAIEPGTIIGSGIIREDIAAYEQTQLALRGELIEGSSVYVGVREGFIDFLTESDLYKSYVPEKVRLAQDKVIKQFKNGQLQLR
ncbi:MAG: hypothetical protein B6241_01605 [Spirochaetaceae bacterium 4572_59]|nr:MAG: hypothetical protein B6241_01605 [Spirochaetaceae bacterium 4572_59]